jgi:hypothetical protein
MYAPCPSGFVGAGVGSGASALTDPRAPSKMGNPTEGKRDDRGWTYILVMFAEHRYRPAWITSKK